MLEKVVSGGQTGVDKAALDAAMKLGIHVGGWCPLGRWAEDGRIDEGYPLQETPSAEPAQRTEWNVRDSDATTILSFGSNAVSRGTLLTREMAKKHAKPLLEVDLGSAQPKALKDWVEANHVATLNIAGPRESEASGVYSAALKFLLEALA